MDGKGLTTGDAAALTPEGRGTDEESRVMRRLERIEALDRERAPTGELLGELRELVHEAEALARTSSGAGSRDAVGKVGEEAEGMR